MADDLRQGGIAVLDFGSQYTQLITRRIRESGVYAKIFPYDTPLTQIRLYQPKGIIYSGGPNNIYETDAPEPTFDLPDVPLLGICYGMQLITQHLGGDVQPSMTHEYGQGTITINDNHRSPLFRNIPFELDVWMSHGDYVKMPPSGFDILARSDNGLLAAISDETRRIYGVQFHPEVAHTPLGIDILNNFIFVICGCEAKWSPGVFIDNTIKRIRTQVGDNRVLLALSGGVDSAVTAALLNKAIGDQLISVFVNTGLLRKNEPQQVVQVFRHQQGMNLTSVDATETFLDALQGIIEPEIKRKIIGGKFIDVFTEEANKLDDILFLAQGTIYPDVIESAAGHKSAKTIKSHHNVGGLPDDFKERFDLVEPLRDCFKDEVRTIGTALGLPDEIVYRHPFPGPGLAIRCLGNITWQRLEALREADAIFLDELTQADLMNHGTSQAFAVLLPVRSVGVMGDNRTYEEVLVLRAVTTDDFMTADWARLPYELLARTSNRIINTVKGINRVTFDITSKPPATIEWE